MDRIALAKRLENLSSVFSSYSPYNRDLKAMAYALNKMAEDKFTTILSADFSDEAVESCMCGGGHGAPVIAPEMPGAIPMDGPMGGPLDIGGAKPKVIILKPEAESMSAEATAKTAGMFWSKDASKAVIDNLLRDVVGMNKSVCCDTGSKLEDNQVPDGTHGGLPEKAQTLTEEQTPDISKSIKSDIVEKSHGAVQKEAGSKKGPGVPDGTGPNAGKPGCKMKDTDEKEASSVDEMKKKKEEADKKKALKVLEGKKKDKSASEESAEKKEDEAQEMVEEAKENLEKAEEKLEEAKEEEKKEEDSEKDAASSSSMFDGIELTASMDDVELDANETAELSKLFV